jgi:hypothetical protein
MTEDPQLFIDIAFAKPSYAACNGYNVKLRRRGKYTNLPGGMTLISCH